MPESVLRVLLADDHEVVRAGLRALLATNDGLSVVGEARDGGEACRRACELKPDVLVMDVSMPVLDGISATERVLRECPEVRVLALTMHDDRGHLGRVLQAGASGYVLKRAAAEELVRAIRIVAAGGVYVDPILAASALRARSAPTEDVKHAVTADALSEREEEVLRLIAWGHSNKDIAGQLRISTKTVETYKARITEKLGIRSRSEIVRYALRMGWLADA